MYSEKNKEAISAFAFNTAKGIEDFLVQSTDNLEAKNMNLEALILSFRQRVLDADLGVSNKSMVLALIDEHFNIKTTTSGKTG